jgi:hypothetical protein
MQFSSQPSIVPAPAVRSKRQRAQHSINSEPADTPDKRPAVRKTGSRSPMGRFPTERSLGKRIFLQNHGIQSVKSLPQKTWMPLRGHGLCSSMRPASLGPQAVKSESSTASGRTLSSKRHSVNLVPFIKMTPRYPSRLSGRPALLLAYGGIAK